MKYILLIYIHVVKFTHICTSDEHDVVFAWIEMNKILKNKMKNNKTYIFFVALQFFNTYKVKKYS